MTYEWIHPGYICLHQLIESRKWTKELVHKYLTPDLYETNPHNATQIMRLYLLEKVYNVESSPRFQLDYIQINKSKLNDRVFLSKEKELERKINRRNRYRRLKLKECRHLL